MRWRTLLSYETGGKDVKKLLYFARSGMFRPGDQLVVDDVARMTREDPRAFLALLVLLTLLGVQVSARLLGPAALRIIKRPDGKLSAAEVLHLNRCAVRHLYGEQVVPRLPPGAGALVSLPFRAPLRD